MNKMKPIIILSILLLIIVTAAVGCKSPSIIKQDNLAAKQAGSKSGTDPASTSSPKQVPASSKAKPALSQVSFTLQLKPQQAVDEYLLPIYLKAQSVLHLAWSVTGEGDQLKMALTTPDGKYVGVKADGGVAELLPSKAGEKLYRNGSLILRPSQQSWGDGYYIFRPYIVSGDKNMDVKVLYWIEE